VRRNAIKHLHVYSIYSCVCAWPMRLTSIVIVTVVVTECHVSVN
jgi:hypothetical protein